MTLKRAQSAPSAHARAHRINPIRRICPIRPISPIRLASAAAYSHWLTSPDPAVVANAMICLIHQTNYLLDRQIAALEQQFVRQGGYSERLAAARIAERARSHRLASADPSDPADRQQLAPHCPLCGKPMALRTARQGARAGSQFWGCSAYRECKGTRQL
jgi:restriction system protein